MHPNSATENCQGFELAVGPAWQRGYAAVHRGSVLLEMA